MVKRIEVWFTGARGREYENANDLREARSLCKRMENAGKTEMNVDVTFYTENNGEAHDLIEGKSKWYSYKNGKLVSI